MTNISRENEFSPSKILNGSEINFYSNINNNNIILSQEYISTVPNQKIIDSNKSNKNNQKLIKIELEFLKMIKIKFKIIKELITNKFDKSFKELSNNIKNKKIIIALDKLKLIENIKWRLIEEINDLEILNKDYEKKFNVILNKKEIHVNRSHSNNIKSVNISNCSNSNKRNSFSDSILPNNSTNKTPKLSYIKKKSKIPYMNRSKSGAKFSLNKSINNKSYNEIKKSLSKNKKSYNNIQDYIKNKNNSILSNSNMEESLNEININSYKIKIEEKEKELNYLKEKLENEKLLNKQLLNELDKIKYNKSIQKTKNHFGQILNKNNTKNDDLLVITNKLTKLIEMVINFSYSMSHLRGNVYSKIRKNESIKAYENLNNDLKQIYNEFENISKYLKNASGINSKNNELQKTNKNETKLKNNKSNNINNNNINNINNSNKYEEISNTNINNNNEEVINKENNLIYNSNNKYKEINSPIKEENSLEITNEEKNNLEEIKKNLNDYTIKISNANENNNNLNKDEKYKKINIIQNKNRHKKDENEENDFEKSKRTSLNFFLHTNSDKVFTFRNNSLMSNKDGEKLTEKSGGIDLRNSIPNDINKIIEENRNLKMQLASEMLKNNTEKSDSHNDEEYEEIISGLKKKLEDKENKINELQKIIDSNNNSFKNNNINDKMNNSMNEMEKIKGNYSENISTITDIYENMLIEKENKIKELTNEVNIIEKELEELNDKYNKEKENVKLINIKINGLENERNILLEQINSFKNKEKELKLNFEKNLEIIKNEYNNKIKSQTVCNKINNYNISNYDYDNINDNNFNSASNRQINKQKEELILLKKKFKEILDNNNKLSNEVNDINLNQIKEKEEFINMMRNTFTKFLKVSKIDNKNKEYAMIVLKLLGYNEDDIKEMFKNQKKGLFGIFQ